MGEFGRKLGRSIYCITAVLEFLQAEEVVALQALSQRFYKSTIPKFVQEIGSTWPPIERQLRKCPVLDPQGNEQLAKDQMAHIRLLVQPFLVPRAQYQLTSPSLASFWCHVFCNPSSAEGNELFSLKRIRLRCGCLSKHV